MSIKLTPAATRLTVLGSGWNNSSIESGDGLTEDGKLWEDIAGDLGYDFGSSVDWDNLASGRDWADEVVTDENGNVFIPETVLVDLVDSLQTVVQGDKPLVAYAIDSNVLKNLYGGMVSQETSWDESDPARPHKFYPDVYYIQVSENSACLFQEVAFWHREADGGNITVNDISITIRSGSSMKVYSSTCATNFSDNYLPSEYKSYPIQYVCWQCLWGSFKEMLIAEDELTKTIEELIAGEVYEIKVLNGTRYFDITKSRRKGQ